jgi:molecular chaperone GrpE (heat shock protein)
MCPHILSLALLTLLTGHQTSQLAMRPSPSPGAGPSTSNAAMPSPSRANNSVADVKGFLDDQAQKIDELERELRAEKQKTRDSEQKIRGTEQEAARWKQAYEGLKTERDNYFNRTQAK